MHSAAARISIVALLAFASCQTPSSYRWGATDDPDWAARVGTARMSDVVRVLGQPHEKQINAAGETKARWPGKTLTVNPDPGSMQDYSVQHTEERAQWHDMLFAKDGLLLRAWLSDQRRLADSEAP